MSKFRKKRWKLNQAGQDLLRQAIEDQGLELSNSSAVAAATGVDRKTAAKILNRQFAGNGRTLEQLFEKLHCQAFVLETHCEEVTDNQSGLNGEVANLLSILESGGTAIQEQIQQAYAQCLPEGMDRPAATIEAKLAILADLPQPKANPKPLLRFAGLLVQNQLVSSDLRQQLQNWGRSQSNAFDALLAELTPSTAVTVESAETETYLMIRISPHNQFKNRYELAACLIRDPGATQAATDIPQTRLEVPIDSDSAYGRSVGLDQIPTVITDLIDLCTDQLHNIALGELTVQCFLPLEDLHHPFDQEAKAQIGRELLPIAAECKAFVVRALDRQKCSVQYRSYKLKQRDWEQKWQQLMGCADSEWRAIFEIGCEDISRLEEMLALSNASGWCFTTPGASDLRERLFDEMLINAVPIALWVRDACPMERPHDQVSQLLPGCVGLLPKTVTQARKAARFSAEMPIATHIALLWDNPFRPFPELDWESA